MPGLLHPNRRDFGAFAAAVATSLLAVPQLGRSAAAQVTSEGRGEGKDHIFDMLIQDHQKISETLQQIKQAERPDSKMQGIKELDRMLLIHDLAEGLVVYPALRTLETFQVLASHLYEEHADIKTHMFTLQTVPPGEAQWSESLSELEQLIKGHVQQEEQEAFPEYQQTVGPEVIQTLTRMAQQKRAMVSG